MLSTSRCSRPSRTTGDASTSSSSALATVVVWLSFGGTPTASGRSFEAGFCDVIEVEGGLITSLTMYADWPALLHQMAP